MQFGEVPADSEFSGILSKKKLDHGRFEDPYRSKVQCWVLRGFFHILPLSSDVRLTGEIEKVDISKCQVWKSLVYTINSAFHIIEVI
jgi:hypothetical protein